MTFTRTASGISNAHIFLGVNRTVYVEGHGDDEKYWKSVFSAFYQGPLKFHFKSVGSRTAVLPYAEGIASKRISNTIAILDADYEGLRFSTLPIPNILYTFGYSFENDLFGSRQIIKLLSQLCSDTKASEYRKVLSRIQRATNELHTFLVLDFVAQFNDHYILEKNGNTCLINIKNNDAETICSQSLASIRKRANTRHVTLKSYPIKRIRDKLKEEPKGRWMYGHLWRAIVSKCISDHLRKNASVTINPDGIENLAINNIRTVGSRIFPQKQRLAYYRMTSSIS